MHSLREKKQETLKVTLLFSKVHSQHKPSVGTDLKRKNPQNLTNYLICAVTVAPLLIISKHSIINRIHSDSLVHLVSYILIYEFAEESYFLCVVETSSSLLETPRPQFGLSTSLSLRPPIVDSAVPWACLCRHCSLSCFSSQTSFREYLKGEAELVTSCFEAANRAMQN